MTMSLLEIQKQCGADSEAWFGEQGDGITRELPFLALCIAGEAGEFCNLLKKIGRGSLEMNGDTQYLLAMELTDIFTYVACTADLMGINLEEAYKHKRDVNVRRFQKDV